MTKIKLCGLTRPQDIQKANELKPDFVGFVFAKKSKRYADPLKALELRKLLSEEIQTVGVFVNEPIDDVVLLVERGIIQVIQLHGSEDESYISELRKRVDSTIVQAFSLSKDTETAISAANASSADYVLLDSGKGGTGTSFDWNLLKAIKRPYFLAGGLSLDNIKEAVKSLQPYAVDVSSGIETDGVKDPVKMETFVREVRDAAI